MHTAIQLEEMWIALDNINKIENRFEHVLKIRKKYFVN